MQRIIHFWKSGIVGKLVIGCGGLIGLLFICAVFGALFGQELGREAARTTTPAAPIAEIEATTTPRAREVSAVTDTPRPTDTPRATETPHPTDTPAPPTSTPVPPTPTPLPTDTPAPTPTPEPQRFAGHGQQVSPKFVLSTGLAVFRMTHDGGSNFAIVLLDDKGNYVELLVNEIGGFDGAKAVGIEQTGTYLLDIQADGNWIISVEQPSAPATAPIPPRTFTGRAQQVSPMFRLAKGLVTFRMTHDGSSNFAIILLDDKGSYIELLVNQIAEFDGAKAVGVKRAGVYLLDITADGNWMVTIEQ